MITVKDCTNSNKIQLANIALENNLYVRGWNLQDRLSEIVLGFSNYPIALIYYNKIPLGVCIVNTEKNVFEIFVTVAYRNRGIGSLLINHMKKLYPNVKGNLNGEFGTNIFFRKCGLECINIYKELV